VVALALSAFAIVSWAVPARDLVRRARDAAAHEDWNASARSLEEVLSAGIDSSDVLYDLGTAYAHAGRFGEAIWRLETVTRRSPFAFDAQQNLRAARLSLAHRDAARTGRAVVETAVPFWTWLAELLPVDWAVALTLLSEAIVFACLFALRRGRTGEIARVASAAAGILFVAAGLFTGAIVLARQFTPPAGIVLHDGLHLLRSPAADAMPDAIVREGERVVILARDGTFARVRTPGGETGWLTGRDVGALDD
jgi:hypothetical protein